MIDEFKTYEKIPNIFMRDINGTKKLIDGAYSTDELSVLRNTIFVFEEKIDGTNVRVCWDGYDVCVGGRGSKSQFPRELKARLDELFMTDEAASIFEQMFGMKKVILFGEGYGGKIQGIGKEYCDAEDFILFDVWVDGKYLTRSNKEDVAKAFGLKVVPMTCCGSLQHGIDYVKNHPKSLVGSGYMEGVVAKPLVELRDGNGSRIVTKIKWKDMRELC